MHNFETRGSSTLSGRTEARVYPGGHVALGDILIGVSIDSMAGSNSEADMLGDPPGEEALD